MTTLSMSNAEQLIHVGQLHEAVTMLQKQVRHDPSNARCRLFLFQVLALLGQWDRAMTQLNVAVELDHTNLSIAQMGRVALNGESLRAEVFAGRRLPEVFGQHEQWIRWLIQANQMTALGCHKASTELRKQAIDAAPATRGTIDQIPFQWLTDTDTRLGPVIEAIVGSRYYWIPISAIEQLVFEPPTDLRGLVWLPIHVTSIDGTQIDGLIPTRYPGSEASTDSHVVMSSKTDWIEHESGFRVGLGQRMWSTDRGDYPLLETRRICFGHI